MSVVVDSSVTLAWVFSDERTDTTEDVLDLVTRSGALVPSLWHLEIANGLYLGVRRKRISPRERDDSLADLEMLDIAVDSETSARAWSTTLALSERFGLTAYDAAYLELAERRDLPLATPDKALRSAAVSLGIPVMPPEV